MKHHTKFLLFFLLLCSSFISNAQSTQAGLGALGHSPLFGGVPLRYVGWDASVASNAIPLSIEHRGTNNINFLTGGLNRMTILGTASGATAGFVGIGTPTPNKVLQIHDGVDAQLQITNTTTGLGAGNGMLVGLFNNSNNAFIANQQNAPLFFSTNGANAGAVKMSILANGNTGVGVGFLNPLHLVDVRDGNINIGQGIAGNVAASPQSYMIGGNNILWHKGEVRNLFVGVNAGANTGTGPSGALAVQNTYIGFNAGAANTSGQRNTAIGANAGQSIATGNFNTFIGTEAGRSLVTGSHNTFVGEQAGDNQVSGTENAIFGAHAGSGNGSGVGNRNTMLGAYAGPSITNGDDNTFVGRSAGANCDIGSFNSFIGVTCGAFCSSGLRNTMNGTGSGVFTSTGNDNVFMGFQSGRFNSTGSNNTYIGTNAGTPFFGPAAVWNVATNATAIGNDAKIRRCDVMILGNNAVNVGIGLSNDNTPAQGPQNKLEIDAGISNTGPSPSGALGASGLRFRDLHSGNTTVANGVNGVNNSKVLTVDKNGDVVLTDALPGPVGPSGGIVNAQNGVSLLNPSTVELGNAVGGTAATLSNDRQIPMAGNTVLFNGQGRVKVGQNAAVANPASIIPTFEVNNTSNATNNNGMLIQDNSANGQTNRTGLDIKMNLNSSSADLIALNVEHSNNVYNQTNGLASKLVSVKGLDWNQNGVQDDEVFGIRSSGYAGFGLDQAYYSRATLGIGNLSQGSSAFGTVANPLTGFNGLTSLFAYTKNPPLNQRVRTADIYSEGNISVEGLAAKAVLFGSGLSFGLRGEGVGNTTQGVNESNVGVYGIASNATGGWNVGGYFVANTSNYVNYAVYARTAGTGANDFAARFDGNVNVNGGYYLGGISFTSDQQFKTNVDTITNPLGILNQLKPRSYSFDTTNAYGLNFSSKKQYGFVAQDVEQILPELVNNQHKPADLDSAGVIIHPAINYKSLNYNAFFAILTAAMQKQQNVIDSLKHAVDSLTTKVNTKDSIQDVRLAALEAAIASCCASASTRQSNSNVNQLDIELSDKDAIVLNQNVPNPFAEQTTITYNVPASVGKAQLIFFNTTGQVIQTVDIKTRGKGKVNVFASDLSSGLYNYSLIADGKVIDSKKMVRE